MSRLRSGISGDKEGTRCSSASPTIKMIVARIWYIIKNTRDQLNKWKCLSSLLYCEKDIFIVLLSILHSHNLNTNTSHPPPAFNLTLSLQILPWNKPICLVGACTEISSLGTNHTSKKKSKWRLLMIMPWYFTAIYTSQTSLLRLVLRTIDLTVHNPAVPAWATTSNANQGLVGDTNG